nr:hypothetical protein CFP56_31948 [Quercus suber]
MGKRNTTRAETSSVIHIGCVKPMHNTQKVEVKSLQSMKTRKTATKSMCKSRDYHHQSMIKCYTQQVQRNQNELQIVKLLIEKKKMVTKLEKEAIDLAFGHSQLLQLASTGYAGRPSRYESPEPFTKNTQFSWLTWFELFA